MQGRVLRSNCARGAAVAADDLLSPSPRVADPRFGSRLGLKKSSIDVVKLALLLIGKARKRPHRAPEWAQILCVKHHLKRVNSRPGASRFFVLAFVLPHPAMPRSNKAATAMAAQNLVLRSVFMLFLPCRLSPAATHNLLRLHGRNNR